MIRSRARATSGALLTHLSRCLLSGLLVCWVPLPASAKTLLLDGLLESRISTVQQIHFDVESEIRTLTFRFALPTSFSTKTTSQQTEGLQIRFTSEPASVVDDLDRFVNRFKKATWEHLKQGVTVTLSFTAHVKADLQAIKQAVRFPLEAIPRADAAFLQPTSMVQSDSAEIVSLSRELVKDARTAHEAVTAILDWVADHVKYTYNPPQYDALYTLKEGKGNCQNFAHFSMALLRAAGIPARIVGGISLRREWKVPVGDGFIVQNMGQGGHAWIEIFAPDVGWLAYDPQQSRQFTSTRYVKQTHGLDSRDINDSWSASPSLPRYRESIEANFHSDTVDVKLAAAREAPISYMMSTNLLAERLPPPVTPSPRPTPPPPSPPVPKKRGDIEFGNMEFPTFVDLYRVSGNEATKILDKETAEYVTSQHRYAQAFAIEDPLLLRGVALAMRRFGGDGALYVDVVKDEQGRPSLSGLRSLPVSLSEIRSRPGYYWIDFAFAKGKEVPPRLEAGRYWIIPRHSGEAIVNWFYIPGNPYGDAEDTRSTVRGYKWEDLLNYDFAFMVKANRP